MLCLGPERKMESKNSSEALHYKVAAKTNNPAYRSFNYNPNEEDTSDVSSTNEDSSNYKKTLSG